MSKVREEVIERHLVNEVKKAGGIAYKFTSPGRRGVPDRIVLLPNGKIIFVECKAPGEKPRPDSVTGTREAFCIRVSRCRFG